MIWDVLQGLFGDENATDGKKQAESAEPQAQQPYPMWDMFAPEGWGQPTPGQNGQDGSIRNTTPEPEKKQHGQRSSLLGRLLGRKGNVPQGRTQAQRQGQGQGVYPGRPGMGAPFQQQPGRQPVWPPYSTYGQQSPMKQRQARMGMQRRGGPQYFDAWGNPLPRQGHPAASRRRPPQWP